MLFTNIGGSHVPQYLQINWSVDIEAQVQPPY